MPESKSKRPLKIEHKDIHASIGHAVDAYARTEAAQTELLNAILGVGRDRASAIFHSVQNVRRSNAMLQALLSFTYADRYRNSWRQCAKFLEKLAQYRNAIVHGHVETTIVLTVELDDLPTHSLINPAAGRAPYEMQSNDFPRFIEDCGYIESVIRDFTFHLWKWEDDPASRQKYLALEVRQNLADIQQLQKPRARKPQR